MHLAKDQEAVSASSTCTKSPFVAIYWRYFSSSLLYGENISAAVSNYKLTSLAYMEVTVALATFIRRIKCELYETDFSDIEIKHDFLIPSPRFDSKGVRVKITGVEA